MDKNRTNWTDRIITLFLFPILFLVVLVWLALFIVSYPFVSIYEYWLTYRFWQRHGKHGRFVLFVYSDSPNWKDYIESNILPRLESQAITLNWSRRSEWPRINPFEAKIFYHWAGEKEFNPMAIIFRPGGRVKEVRFWQGFRDYKHGREKALQKAEQSLFAEVEDLGSKNG